MELRENTAFYNKQYRDQPDGSFLLTLQRIFLKKLLELGGGSSLPSHIFYADDCFVVYRNLGFLKDRDFQSALQAAGVDSVLMGRVWRIWVLAYTMHSRWSTRGAVLDCGTYNARALEVCLHYCTQTLGARFEPIYAADLFENPPVEAKKSDHGPLLFEDVKGRLSKYSHVHVVKGALPGSLDSLKLKSVTWCQIDLNSSSSDANTFTSILDVLEDGAIVIFDDYGFSRYAETQMAIDKICVELGTRVLELPTGQGLYIHRC